MFLVLKSMIKKTGKIEEEYGGYRITVIDEKSFPWKEVFVLLKDSGFQIWINKNDDSQVQIMSKPEVN